MPRTKMTTTDEYDDECGVAYDHELPPYEVIDGMVVVVCDNCGAELMWDVEDEEDGN